MELLLKRTTFTNKSTIGDLYIDGKKECFILEDKDRSLDSDDNKAIIENNKVYGETAIPTGKYEVVITMSPRFKKRLPLLLNVPGYEGIRIHPGNTSEHSHGCLLPGSTKNVDFVGNSRVAFDRLFDKLEEGLKKGKVYITITND